MTTIYGLRIKMKTWKKIAVGGLVTLMGLGYFGDRSYKKAKKEDELIALENQPKFKQFNELKKMSIL